MLFYVLNVLQQQIFKSRFLYNLWKTNKNALIQNYLNYIKYWLVQKWSRES